MIFSFHGKTPIKCKQAKFIRIPKVSTIEVKSNEIADLFFCKDNDHKTILYVKGNTINFIRMHHKEYRYKVKIIELFDYKTWTCNLMSIDRKKYNLMRPTTSPEIFVKSPSGDLYCIVDYTYYFEDGESDKDYDKRYDEEDNNNYRVFAVHNLTKGKALISYAEKDGSWVREQDGIALFPYFFATNPLYNSFIIVMNINVHNALYGSSIYLVNLIEDTVEEIPFDIEGYIKSRIEDLMYEIYIDNLDYSEYDEDEDFDPAEHYNEYYGFDADDIFDTENITVSLISHTSDFIKYQWEVPVYSNCEAQFGLYLKNDKMFRKTGYEFKIGCDILLSIYLENNELNILVSCKELWIDGFVRRYRSESTDILVHKRYPIQIINQIDLTKSQLYSVTSFFKDYLFKDGNLYRLKEDTYQMAYNLNEKPPLVSRRNGVYFIELESKFNEKFVVIPPRYVGKNREKYVNIGNKILYFKSIKEIANMYSKDNKYGIIFDIQKYTTTLDIKELLKRLEAHIKKVLQNKGVKSKIMHYDYYFSEKTGDLYMFVIIKNDLDEEARFMIVNQKISEPIYYSKIILLSDPYEIEVYSDSEEEPEKRRMLKNKHKLINEIINAYKCLCRAINKDKNKKNEDIKLIDFLDYHFHKTINHIPSAWSEHNDDLVVRYHISFSDSYKEFKDIRHNRQSKIQYEGLSKNKNKITINKSDIKVERYENILIHRIDIEMRGRHYDFSYTYNFLIIISEMEVVKTI
jgi:Tfp pilus assembly protein PilZ